MLSAVPKAQASKGRRWHNPPRNVFVFYLPKVLIHSSNEAFVQAIFQVSTLIIFYYYWNKPLTKNPTYFRKNGVDPAPGHKLLFLINLYFFTFSTCRKAVWLFFICAESTVHHVLVNYAASFASKDASKPLKVNEVHADEMLHCYHDNK